MNVERTARVILLDRADKLFLFHAPFDEGFRWLPPGGGLKHDEAPAEAARREVSEETGWQVTIGSCLWTRQLFWKTDEGTIDHRENWYSARLDTFAPQPPIDPSNDPEAAYHWKWWSVTDISASSDVFVPRRLAHYLSLFLSGRLPSGPLALRE